MTLTIIYPTLGRGCFTTGAKLGGTLNANGMGAGSYYRAPSIAIPMPGLVGFKAVRDGTTCDVNDYAVHKAVKALQAFFSTAPDGVFGSNTAKAVMVYQKEKGLVVDGIIGPATSKTLFEPMFLTAILKTDPAHERMLRTVVLGTVALESGNDPGAIGVSTPTDWGIGQISEIHSTQTTSSFYIKSEDRLEPVVAIPWITRFIDNNLKVMNYDLDASIAAYNLGITGAQRWISAGRPQTFSGRDVWNYILRVKTLGTS